MEKLKHEEKKVSKKTRQELTDKGSFKNSRFRCHSQLNLIHYRRSSFYLSNYTILSF